MSLPPRARVAALLWIVFAIVAWNVVFDRVIINAGREYAKAAQAADRASQKPLLINDWMRPAVTRAFWLATATGTLVGITGLAGIAWAGRIDGRKVRPPTGLRARG